MVARAPDRFLLGIVGGSVGLIAIGIVAVVLAARGPAPPAVDPDSPVGVVQAYLEAVRSGDSPRARGLLTTSARETFDRQKESHPRPVQAGGTQRRILIEPVETGPERAEVKVTVSRTSARSEPFSTGAYHQELNARLVREGGAWRLAQPIEPWAFLY
jgi:hypothetical protein